MVMGVERPAGAKAHVLWGRWRCSKLSPSRSSGDFGGDTSRGGLLPAAPVGASGRAATGLLIFVSENEASREAAALTADGQTAFSIYFIFILAHRHIAAPRQDGERRAALGRGAPRDGYR